jgi:hypothetical protein
MPVVRRVVLRVTIGSFAVAAVLGIAALLRPGHFGSTEGRVLLTTVVVGVASVLMLCYLAATGERTRFVGVAGGVATVVAATSALVLVWVWLDEGAPTALVRTFGVSTVMAVTLAQFSLLLAVLPRRPTLVRLLAATVVAGTVLACLASATILGWNPTDTGGRLIGVVMILDVLGTVVTLALGVFGGGAPGRAGSSLGLTLPPDLADAVRARAAETARTPEDVVLGAVRAHLGSDAKA